MQSTKWYKVSVGIDFTNTFMMMAQEINLEKCLFIPNTVKVSIENTVQMATYFNESTNKVIELSRCLDGVMLYVVEEGKALESFFRFVKQVQLRAIANKSKQLRQDLKTLAKRKNLVLDADSFTKLKQSTPEIVFFPRELETWQVAWQAVPSSKSQT
jgi:hypothetical protein